MNELPVEAHESVPGMINVTAQVRMKGGDEFFLCDDWDSLRAALDGDERFVGHKIAGMAPVETIINPAHVATAERMPHG